MKRFRIWLNFRLFVRLSILGLHSLETIYRYYASKALKLLITRFGHHTFPSLRSGVRRPDMPSTITSNCANWQSCHPSAFISATRRVTSLPEHLPFGLTGVCLRFDRCILHNIFWYNWSNTIYRFLKDPNRYFDSWTC